MHEKVFFLILFSANSGLAIPSRLVMSVPGSLMWVINNSYPLLDLSFYNMCRSHGDELCELLPCGAKQKLCFYCLEVPIS